MQEKHKLDQYQHIVNRWFATSSSYERSFNVEDLVLKWDKAHDNKGEHTMFQNLWLGPFVISGNWVLVLFSYTT